MPKGESTSSGRGGGPSRDRDRDRGGSRASTGQRTARGTEALERRQRRDTTSDNIMRAIGVVVPAHALRFAAQQAGNAIAALTGQPRTVAPPSFGRAGDGRADVEAEPPRPAPPLQFTGVAGNTANPLPRVSPPVPIESPIDNTDTVRAVAQARLKNQARAALARGRSSTILTSGLGLTTPARTAPKTVLGA